MDSLQPSEQLGTCVVCGGVGEAGWLRLREAGRAEQEGFCAWRRGAVCPGRLGHLLVLWVANWWNSDSP